MIMQALLEGLEKAVNEEEVETVIMQWLPILILN